MPTVRDPRRRRVETDQRLLCQSPANLIAARRTNGHDDQFQEAPTKVRPDADASERPQSPEELPVKDATQRAKDQRRIRMLVVFHVVLRMLGGRLRLEILPLLAR